jgi:cytochrome o ubiquinol oxidase subunit 2
MPKPKRVRRLLIIAGLIVLLFLFMQPWLVHHLGDRIAVLFPAGLIGIAERNLLLVIQGIMLLVIIPVYVLTFIFSWKYRADNPNAKYDPDLVDNVLAEVIWWTVPLVLTIIISVMTWQKTHELDPYKPIASDRKPITIQVVALQWKWLFIYPEEKVASLNFLAIPTDTPIHFLITADAPMNSFWIPDLGGQIYAMPAMQTQLFLIANEPGDFRGSSANISGEGFASMHFVTRATDESTYREWINSAKQSSLSLDDATYAALTKPSQGNPPTLYRLDHQDLFRSIMAKYMHPPTGGE